jgi:glucokinase
VLDLFEHFRTEVPIAFDAVGVGIAGPVRDGACTTTNLPWSVDVRELRSALGSERVAMVNDFHATALGLLALSREDTFCLQTGEVSPGGHLAVLGAGTGLGEALLVPSATGPIVIPTEGGHTDFAPRNELEDALLAHLRALHPEHVSVERVVSGPGLLSIFEFLVSSRRAEPLETTRARVSREDGPAVVGELGIAGTDPACVAALELFVALYGAEAGNFALKSLPTGGLYVAGGIAAKIAPALRCGRFLDAFLAKGRMRAPLERIALHVVTSPDVGLLGARVLAKSLTLE